MNSSSRIMNSLAAEGAAGSIVSNADQSAILVRSFFPATEGITQPGSYLKLGLCLAGGGKVAYGWHGRASRMNWRCGDVLVMAPHADAEFTSPDVQMLGLAVDLQTMASSFERAEVLRNLDEAAARIVTDEVIPSVVMALWTCAEHHGPSGAFLDAGIDVVLQRLAAGPHPQSCRERVRPLSQRQLHRVSEYVRSRIATDIRVPELAALVGMEPRRFARALKAATGFKPYAYLVSLRMQHAKDRIDDGESVINTALSVGYGNPSKFTAAFQRIVGCTPSQWRRRGSSAPATGHGNSA